MKLLAAFLFLTAAFGLAAEGTRVIPVPRDTCPQRWYHCVALYPRIWSNDLIKSFFFHYFSEVDYYIQVDQFKVMYLSGDPEDSRDLPPTYYKRCVDFSSALAVSQAITEIVNITNANLGGKGTLLIFRETLEGATGYSDAAQSAATNGLRVVTIDFNCSKAQAIATLTASQPRDRNAFVFQSYVDGIANIPLLLQTIRDDIGRKCVVSERMTVHTFDGAAYKHTGIGDYVLFRQDPLWGFNGTYQPDSYVDSIEIQVRKTQCSDTSKNQACISAIGIRRGGYDYQYAMTLQYDRELNDNVVTLNGNIVPADSALYSFGLFVRRVEPNIGLHADYYIAAMHTPLISVDFFTEQSRDPLIVINALPYSFATSTGMCGTFDSCLENEFVTADGKIVVGANESAPTWRVSGGASIFEWDQYLVDVDPEASLSLRQPFIPADWKSVDGEGETATDAGAEMLNADALYALCSDFCLYHRSGVAAIDNDDGTVCKNFCDEQTEDLFGLTNFSIFSKFNDTNLPPVSAGYLTDGSNITFIAPQGGVYTFEVAPADCCTVGNESANVTINVKCSRKLGVEIQNGDDIVLALQPFPIPGLRLTAKLSGDNVVDADVRVAWRIIKAPKRYNEIDEQATYKPLLLYPNSLTPLLLPDFAGNFTLEVVAFDGCTRASDMINISFACVDIDLYPEIYNGTAYWTGARFSTSTTPTRFEWYSKCSMMALPITYNNAMFLEVWSDINHDMVLSLPSPQDPLLSLEREEDVNGYSENYYLHWHAETPITTNVTVTTENVTDSDDIGDWSTITNVGGITRVEAATRTLKYFVEGTATTTEITSESRFIHSRQCRIRASHYSSYGTATGRLNVYHQTSVITADELPEWANTSEYRRVASLTAPFSFGICAGIYLINATISNDIGCKNQTAEFDYHVTCDGGWMGPYAKTLSPCFPVVYDYDNHRFVSVTLQGGDSLDRYRSAYMAYKWTPIRWPATTTPADFMSGPITTTTLSVSPDVAGEYVFEFAVTNGCGIDKEEYTLSAECTGAVTAVLICPASVIVFNYTHQYMNHAFLDGSLSTTTATYSNGDTADLYYAWSVLLPDGTYAPSSVTENFDVTNLAIAGTYNVNFTVTDRCRMDVKTCSFTLNCPNVITADGNISTTSTVINPITHISEPIAVFDLTRSNVAYSHVWRLYYDSLGNGTYDTVWASYSAHNFEFSVSTAGNYMLELVANDGCKESRKQLYFTAMCASNVLTPFIQLTPTSELYVENTTLQWRADSSASSGGTWEGAAVSFNIVWTLVRPDESFISSTSTVWSIPRQTMVGEYNLSLTIIDACKQATRSMNMHIFCASQVKPKAHADATTVTWKGTKFPVVTLDGENSDLTESIRSQVSYTWYFLSAPGNSVFKGVENVRYETVVDNQTTFEDWTLVGTPGFEQRNYTTFKQVLTTKVWKYVTETKLVAPSVNDAVFGACFRPDVPGTYKLQLSMGSTCNTATDTVTIHAVCNGAPTISAVIPSEVNVWSTIALDASGTADPNGDVLSYHWNVELCNGTYNYNSKLANSKSNKVLFAPENPGNYCVSLEVSDGCSNVTESWTFEAKCNYTALLTPLNSEVTSVFSGLGSHVVTVAVVEHKNVVRDMQWLYSHMYMWKLVGYVSAEEYKAPLSGGQIAGIVIGAFAFVAIVTAAIIGLIWFLKKHRKAAAPTL